MMYLRLGIAAIVLLALTAAVAVAYKYRGDAEKERSRRVVAEINLKAAADENTKLANRIVAAEEQARVNDEIVLDLANSMANIRAEQLSAIKEQNELESTDDTVKTYLDQSPPPALRRLLDKRVGVKDDAAPTTP